MDKNKLILPISILLGCIVLGGFYYAGQVNKQQSIEKQQQVDLKKQENAKVSLQSCLEITRQNYLSMRASNCISYAKRMEDGYRTCAENYDPAGCRLSWAKPDPSPGCGLPLELAKSIEDSYNQDRESCFNQYAQ